MRVGDLLSVRIGDRTVSAVLLGMDDGRDYPFEVLVLSQRPYRDYVNLKSVLRTHGPATGRIQHAEARHPPLASLVA